MTQIVEFDFTGSPPAQGGGGSDRIPPGRYGVKITAIKDGKTNDQAKRMVTVNFETVGGDLPGKRLIERFTLGQPGEFGWQRLHAFLLALRLQVKEGPVKVDLDKLVGKGCWADVSDHIMPARDAYAERTVSQIDAYHSPVAQNGTAPAAQAAPAPVAAPVAAEPAPVAAAAPVEAAVAVAEAPVAAVAVAEADDLIAVEDDLDNLFN